MYYYNPKDSSSQRWAWGALALYLFALSVLFFFGEVRVVYETPLSETLYVEFEELPPVEPPTPPVTAMVEPEHTQLDETESFNQVKGSDEQTQTVNPKALFHMAKEGTDEPDDVGNPKAPVGETNRASGTGSGLDVVSGNLDKGLQGRGLVGALPKPDYTANVSGKVIIDVTVDASGYVTSAEFHAQGSTTSNATLVEAARRAARRARFTESESFVQGGMITYIFKMN
jgi:TonB family protein